MIEMLMVICILLIVGQFNIPLFKALLHNIILNFITILLIVKKTTQSNADLIVQTVTFEWAGSESPTSLQRAFE